MKATARAHPIQGLVKYHGLRDRERRFPYHDSISVATAPSHSKTTVAFDESLDSSRYVVDGERLEGDAAERLDRVIDRVRELASGDAVSSPVRLVSENDFPTNVGLGSSSSGFAAAAMAATAAAGLDLSLPEISTIARYGSASAARSVTGGFSELQAGMNDEDCRSARIESPLEDDLAIVVGLVPAYKETDWAHEEAEGSHMFDARLTHVHSQLAAVRDALLSGDFDGAFEAVERDTLSLAAVTMTGPGAWLYWQPRTLAVFDAVRELRADGVPAYFSTDTGATVYVNTKPEYVDRVEHAVAEAEVETRVWEVGGPTEILPESAALF